jgi:uncharacterized protein (TIGR02246 family)
MAPMTEVTGTPEKAVEELHRDLLAAWNSQDARAYAALFTPDATLVGFDGSQVAGSAVEEHLTGIFADHRTATYVSKTVEVRQLADGVALLRAKVGMVPPGRTDVNPATNAVQSLVAVRDDGTWRATLFHNTPAQYHGREDLAEQHTDEMRQVLRRTG